MRKVEMASLFKAIQERNPLVHHMTNVVTVNDCANVTLAVGASPVMATSIEEVGEMAKLADALVLNFGTIQAETFEAMLLAGKSANKKGIPVIFDPVGVGATRFRGEKAKELLSTVNVAIIRGNASEIQALTGGKGKTRGVDSGELTLAPEEVAMEATRKFSATVVISGKVDIVSNGERCLQIANGDPSLQMISGTGCMATSLIGCFAGVTDDYFLAGALGMSVMGVAGERAKRSLRTGDGIGTYKVKLMDEIANLDEHVWTEEVRIFYQNKKSIVLQEDVLK